MKEAVWRSGEAAARREPPAKESANDLLETGVHGHLAETPSGRHPAGGDDNDDDDIVSHLVQAYVPDALVRGTRESQGVRNAGVPAPLLQLPSPDAPAGGEGGESSGRRHGHSGLLLAFLLLAAVALITILALCSYAVYLIGRTAERMGASSGGDAEKEYLDEMRRWTALMARLLDSSGDAAAADAR